MEGVTRGLTTLRHHSTGAGTAFLLSWWGRRGIGAVNIRLIPKVLVRVGFTTARRVRCETVRVERRAAIAYRSWYKEHQS